MAHNTPFFEESGEGNFRDNDVTKLSAPVDCASSVASSEARIGSPPSVLMKTQQGASIAAAPAPPSLTSIRSSSDALPCSNGGSNLFLASSTVKSCASVAPASPKFVFSASEGASLCSRTRMLQRMNSSPCSRSSQEPVKLNLTKQRSRRRCSKCQIRIPVTSITCRCGLTFCGTHRYAEEHDCTYDFKLVGKRQLELENPKILAAKVAKIN